MAQVSPLESVMTHTAISPLTSYLTDASALGKVPDPGFIAYLASLEQINAVSPDVVRAIIAELTDQRQNLKMIASENYTSLPIMEAAGSLAKLWTELASQGHRTKEVCRKMLWMEYATSTLRNHSQRLVAWMSWHEKNRWKIPFFPVSQRWWGPINPNVGAGSFSNLRIVISGALFWPGGRSSGIGAPWLAR